MKKHAFTISKFFFAGLIFWFLIHTSLLKIELITSILMQPRMTGLVLSIFIAMVILNAWRWHRLNRVHHIDVGFTRTIMPTYIGIAFNTILPGSVGGDVVRLYSISKEVPCSKSRIALSILADRIMGLMGIFILVCLIATTHISLFKSHTVLRYFLFACFIFCSIAGIFFIASLFLPKKTYISDHLKKHYGEKKSIQFLLRIFDVIRVYRNQKLVIFECLVVSLIIQLLMVCVISIIISMLKLPTLPWIQYALALSLTQIMNLIPIAPGGLGVGEIAFANSILILNPAVSAPYATVILSYRILGVISYLPAIFLYLFNFKISHISKKYLMEKSSL